MPISSFPPHPSRSDPNTFADKGDAYLAHLESPFVAEANALEANVNAKEASAVAASNAAVAVANAPLWVSGTTYALGFAVYDPVDLLTYRRKIAGAGTTRPGLDGSNWVRVVGTGNARTDQSQTFTGVNTFSQPIAGITTGNAQIETGTTYPIGVLLFAAFTNQNGGFATRTVNYGDTVQGTDLSPCGIGADLPGTTFVRVSTAIALTGKTTWRCLGRAEYQNGVISTGTLWQRVA